jgi:hypothetical protein
MNCRGTRELKSNTIDETLRRLYSMRLVLKAGGRGQPGGWLLFSSGVTRFAHEPSLKLRFLACPSKSNQKEGHPDAAFFLRCLADSRRLRN